MARRVLRRRDTNLFLSTFIGGQAELLVDLNELRLQVHDGFTPGGHPHARLDDIFGRHAVADANYLASALDNFVAFTALTASRTVTLPVASTTKSGKRIFVADKTGLCSSSLPIVVSRTGTDTIVGGTSVSIEAAYGIVSFVSDGVDMWFIGGSSGVLF
jgi:hypothetical protein